VDLDKPEEMDQYKQVKEDLEELKEVYQDEPEDRGGGP
jgi:hypothetical protein